jgi:hypothetical protein
LNFCGALTPPVALTHLLLRQVGLLGAYRQLWAVVRLRSVQQLAGVLLTMRLGVLAAEGAAALKLLERGVSREALAGLVLLDFPCGLISAVLAGRWASKGKPFEPWMVRGHINNHNFFTCYHFTRGNFT